MPGEMVKRSETKTLGSNSGYESLVIKFTSKQRENNNVSLNSGKASSFKDKQVSHIA